MSKTPTNLLEALMPLRQFMLSHRMDPSQLQISMTLEDYERLQLILMKDLPGLHPNITAKPMQYVGIKIGANYDNRLPLRVVGGDD